MLSWPAEVGIAVSSAGGVGLDVEVGANPVGVGLLTVSVGIPDVEHAKAMNPTHKSTTLRNPDLPNDCFNQVPETALTPLENSFLTWPTDTMPSRGRKMAAIMVGGRKKTAWVITANPKLASRSTPK